MITKKIAVFSAVFFFGLASFYQTQAQIKRETLNQIEAILQEKNSRTPVEQKIDSRLLQAVREKLGQQMVKGLKLDPVNVNADKLGNLDVDISATVTDDLLVRLQKLGAGIIFPSAEYHTIRATVNLSMVKTIAAYADVQFIEPAALSQTVGSDKLKQEEKVPGAQTHLLQQKLSIKEREANIRRQLVGYLNAQGSINAADDGSSGSLPITSEGDHTHRADDTRNKYGYSGEGIKIGVLSDSYNANKGAAADVASGNLPGSGNPFGNTTAVTVVQDKKNSILIKYTDEGRAMLQIVHDLVPKAKLFFATADVSEAGFATNIKKLHDTYGCDIIIDDVEYLDEPAFEDGMVAQAVNYVTAGGAMYFSSAGNSGSLAKGTSGVYEGDFNDAGSLPFSGGTKNGTVHNFGTVSTPVNGDIITVAGGSYTLNWSDPLGKSSNDYDLFLISATGSVKASSTNVQKGTQNPFESITAKALVAGDRLVVFKTTAAAKRAFHLATNRGELTVATNGELTGHNAAAAAFSVAAAPAAGAFGPGEAAGPYPGVYSTASKVESFSSDGPRRIFYNADTTVITPGNLLFATNGGVVRAKPDVTAADGVSTTFASSTGLNPFFGTSAAAPHAGAIAALLKSADPTLTPAQIRTLLTTTTLDVEAAGYDNISGYGILQAYQAMSALSPVPFSNVTLDSTFFTDGTTSNHNGVIDPAESGNLVVKLKNVSLVAATAAKGVLTTKTAGVSITKGTITFGNIAANGGSVKNTATPFTFQLNSSVACGTVIKFFLKVTYGGGKSAFRTFEFTANVGAQPYTNLAATLGSPVSGSGYTVSTGTQAGRLSRGATASTCGTLLPNPGILASAGLDPRRYDAYTFTNTGSASQCVTTTMSADSGLDLYCAAFNDSGFVPASPSDHFLADPGQSATIQTYSFDVASGKSFTIVVNEVNSGTLTGTPYKLSVSLSNCSTTTPLTSGISLIAEADNNRQVPMQWSVTNEPDVNRYEIERSTDGSNFSTLSSLPSSALADNEKSYSQTDALPETGNNYYRVKQVNKDGSAAYSNIVLVKINDATGVAVTPNPASGFINVYSKTNMKQIQLVSPGGGALQTIKPNATSYRLEISNLASGVYFLRIETANGWVNQKFVKQ
jgi:Subtilase family/Secretion system C-terminal sorting domain